jgi:hypothetical protein
MQKHGQKGHTRTLGGTVTVLALLGAVASISAGCDDEDRTGVGNGGSGGTAGRGGGGGTSAGTGGTSAGAAGRGGGSNGGSAGIGGASGGTGGSSAGTGGASGASGTSCGGFGSTEEDAGVSDASTDAGSLALHLQIATDLCVKYDQLSGCEPSCDCVEANVGTFTFVEETFPDCIDEAEAFFSCLTTEPVTSFECVGAPLRPEYISGTPPCDDEQAAFNGGFADPSTCED